MDIDIETKTRIIENLTSEVNKKRLKRNKIIKTRFFIKYSKSMNDRQT